MRDGPELLHNMSVPPTCVASYRGLADMTSASAGHAGAMTGRIVGFPAPGWKRVPSIPEMVEMLGATAKANALVALIEQRASELPLPDGALVIAYDASHECVWADLLSFLTVTTKSAGHVWLRWKQPSLSRLSGIRSLSIVVPPLFVDRIGRTPRGNSSIEPAPVTRGTE
jgi:hypothetical protein